VQKDEPQAENPTSGAAIDYYLKNDATTPAALEILDASGATLRTFTSDAAAPAAGPTGRGGIPNTTALWRPTPEPFSAKAGMHRVVWNPVAAAPGGRGGRGAGGGGFGRGGGAPLTGSFTAKLTVNGKSYTQPFIVKPDPRSTTR
jgi:hypothetical protein